MKSTAKFPEKPKSRMIDALAQSMRIGQGYEPPAGQSVWQLPNGDIAFSTGPLSQRGSAGGAGAAAPLGSKREFVGGAECDAQRKANEIRDLKHKKREFVRELHADQRTAASIYHSMTKDGKRAAGRGVCLCGWTQIAGMSVELKRVEEKTGPRVFYGGLAKCGLRWVCPVCTRVASEEARERLNLALEAARARGATPIMLTLTARHHKGLSLKDFWERLSTAEKRLKSLTRWTNINKDGGSMIGFAKAVEATHGRNGWHPHYHIIAVMRTADEGEAMAALSWLKDAWLYQLERVGLDGSSPAAQKRAFQMQGAAEAGSYITKWGAAEELALAGAKTGRSGGRTPWQLLRDARTKDQNRDRQAAAALWWEFVQVFKGVHQIRLSPRLKSLIVQHQAEQPEKTDDDEEKPDPMTVFRFDDPEWEIGRWRRLLMREAAEDASREQAKIAVLAVLLGNVTDRDLLESDESMIDDG